MRFSRDCCAAYNYTTRKYDLDGATIWKADYFQRMPSVYATTTANCSYATTANLTATYSNGSSGVGATLESTANVVFAVDGFNPTVGQSILVKNQSTTFQNGIYTVTQVGSGASHWILTRRTDFDVVAEIIRGTVVYVTNGTTNAATYWVMSSTVTTVGTDAVTWESSVIFGTYGKNVRTQAVDNNYVFVGGSRCLDNAFHRWSVVAFDIDTGEVLWDYDLGADCRKILIDPDGNVVCMHDIGSQNFVTNGTTYLQEFTVLQPDGTLFGTSSFTQSTVPGAPTITARTHDFVINSDGDYHTTGAIAAGAGANSVLLYDGSTLNAFTPPNTIFRSITRIADNDYLGGYAATSSTGRIICLAKVTSQQAAATAGTDFDWYLPEVYYDNAIFALSNDAGPTTGAGTTQAGATALTANKDYTGLTGAAGSGFRLPWGATGDMIGLDRLNGTYTNTGCWLYPPTGGTIYRGSTVTRHKIFLSDAFLCIRPGSWVALGVTGQAFTDYNRICYWSADQIAINSADDIWFSQHGPIQSRLIKVNSSTYVPTVWKDMDSVNWLCLDSDDNVYAFGEKHGASSGPTVSKIDDSGEYVWGHRHSGCAAIYGKATLTLDETSGYGCIQMDPDGLHVICSGFDSEHAAKGPNDSRDDIDFVVDTAPAPTTGRTAVGTDTGVNPDYQVGFSGGACADGTWLVAIINDDSGGDATISGGSTWTRASGGEINVASHSCQLWYKRCGASEPSTYTVSSGGNGSACTLLEIFDADTTNPDDIQHSTNTATAPTATQSSTNALAVIVAADDTNFTAYTEPSGYTLMDGSSFQGTSAIAVKTLSGAGSVSPGNWTGVSGTTSFVWTLIFKP